MKKGRLLMHLTAVATLVSPSSIAMADTYSDGSWTSGSGDMNAQYAVQASYTVEIPASITLPASGYSTLDDGNVKIHAGAQIPTTTSIKVSLSANQHFAAYLGTPQSHDDAVDFMVKMDNQNPLAETTDAVAVLVANAETAHDTGATTNLNVGLAPDQQSKYAGSYVGHVQFTVGTSTASPIVMNEDGTLEFANHKWQIVVDGDIDASPDTQTGEYLVLSYDELTNDEVDNGISGPDEARIPFFENGTEQFFGPEGTSGNGYDRSYLKTIIDQYYATNIGSHPELASCVLPVNLNNPDYNEFKTNIGATGMNFYEYLPGDFTLGEHWRDTRFATTVGGSGSARQAFLLSYGDIHTITGVNADSTDTNVLSGGGSWLRSPGPDGSSAGLMGAGTFDYYGSFEYGGEAVRPALWITTN